MEDEGKSQPGGIGGTRINDPRSKIEDISRSMVIGKKRLPDRLASQFFRYYFLSEKRKTTFKQRGIHPYKTRSQSITQHKKGGYENGYFVFLFVLGLFFDFLRKSSVVTPKLCKSGYFSESDMIFFSVNPGETPIQNDIFPKETTPTECKRVIFFN